MLNSLRSELAVTPVPKARKRRRLRGPHGKFLRKLAVTPEGERCWLIWSRRWHMWRRQAEDTFTSDIAEAGLFPYSKAVAYHDGERNEAFHFSEKVGLFEQRAARLGNA